MDATLLSLSALLLLAPAGSVDGRRDPSVTAAASPWPVRQEIPVRSQGVSYRLADSLEEVTIRAQSMDSPYYGGGQVSPPSGGSSVPQYPATPGSQPYAPPVTPARPQQPGASPFTQPGAPYTPVTPSNPFAPPTQPTAPFQSYGVNGPRPYDFGAGGRLDVGYIAPAEAGAGYGELDVFELDFAMPYVTPTGDGNVFTFTPEYNTRLYNGPGAPDGAPGFPNDLYRFGWDFQYDFLATNSNWSGELGFNPSVNTDFEKSLTIDSVNWDGRAIAYLKTSPTLTLALGALYYDRVDDKILPYAGAIWLPNDRWELRLVFPEPRVSYFAGHVWGKPTWIYARAKYNIEAYQVEVPAGSRNQLQIEDWRIMFGARKEQGWGSSFLEAGWVVGREVDYAHQAPGFDIGDAFTVRGGLRF